MAAFVWSGEAYTPVVLTDDSLRDQLLARDCTDLGRCHLIGPPASLHPLYHGAVWIDLLVAVRLLGGDAATQGQVVLGLMALAAATLFIVVWRWLRPSIALPAVALYLFAISWDQSPSVLTSPSASALPDIVTTASLLCHACSGQLRFLILAAFALGIGINVHVGSLSLVAPFLVTASLASPRPWRRLLACSLITIGVCVVSSSAASRANLIAVFNRGWFLPGFGGAVAALLLSLALAARFRRLSWDARAWIFGAVSILPFALLFLWLVGFEKHHFSPFYLHPIIAPVAGLGAAVLCLPFEFAAGSARALRWIPTGAVAAALPFLVVGWRNEPVPATTDWNSWSSQEAKVITERATARGWRYEDLVFRLQTRACRELITQMSVFAPPPDRVVGLNRQQLQVLKLPRTALAAVHVRGDVVPLGSEATAVLREVESWLRPELGRACRVPADAGIPPNCSPIRLPNVDTSLPERFLFITRSFPEAHALDLPRPYVATYEMPLMPVAGESRELTLADDADPDCGWRITRIAGVQSDGGFPASRVRLHSTGNGPAWLVIEKVFDTGGCAAEADMRYPPCLLEAPVGDPLLALVGAH